MGDRLTPDDPEQIQSLRAKLGLTQTALAKRLGVSFPMVNRWKNGKSRPSHKNQTVTGTITATVETGGVRISQQHVTEAGEVW